MAPVSPAPEEPGANTFAWLGGLSMRDGCSGPCRVVPAILPLWPVTFSPCGVHGRGARCAGQIVARCNRSSDML